MPNSKVESQLMTHNTDASLWHGTTIVTVRKDDSVVVAGDGQVSLSNTVIKSNARKVRPLGKGDVIAGFAGCIVAIAFIVLFHRSHRDVGRNWSVSLQMREDHQLVTSGLFAHIRHPMYAAFFLWGIAQALLLPNAVYGPAGLASVALLYALRIGREEAMLRDHFGEAYTVYSARVPRLVPKLGSLSMRG